MKKSTLFLAVVFVAGFAGLMFYAVETLEGSGGVEVNWVTDTVHETERNHHEVAAGTVDGDAVVAAPISTMGSNPSRECSLTAFDGEGGERWRHLVSSGNCYIHAVADPGVFDFDNDGRKDVVVVTSDDELLVFDALSGNTTFSYNVSSDGYGKPVHGNLSGAEGEETVAVDIGGTAYTFESSGDLLWRKNLNDSVIATPVIYDFNSNGENEVMTGAGKLLSNDGEVLWSTPNASASYLYAAPTKEGVKAVASSGNIVSVVNGTDGDSVWRKRLKGSGGVVSGGDLDSDGVHEIYGGFGNQLYGFNARNGSVDWNTTLTPNLGVRTPPPVTGELTRNKTYIVAGTSDGKLSVVNGDGEVLATHEREASIHAHPTTADINRDGVDEILVIYGDGRVTSLSYTP